MASNVFILGLDDAHTPRLRGLEDTADVRFHQLLTREQMQGVASLPLTQMLDEARACLRSFEDRVDAITGYWDFPVTCLAAILAREFGVPSPDLDSVLACEHKYWSRRRQQEVTAEIPDFVAVDPFDDKVFNFPPLPYPFWLKPVKSFGSRMAFRIPHEQALRQAVRHIRAEIDEFAEPFNEVLRLTNLPEDVAGVDGSYCLAEAPIHGSQCTLEGYVGDSEIEVYGTVDSFRFPNRSSFQRYQYPSRLPQAVQARMAEIAISFVKQIHLRHSAFNIEFFYDASRDRTWLLEVNPRISQSHADIFEKVDGTANMNVMTEVALGRNPQMPVRHGAYHCAAKCFVRSFDTSGRVVRVPTEDEIARIEQEVPGVTVHVVVAEGTRHCEVTDADSYSFELAHLFIGAHDTSDLLDKYGRCVQRLEPVLRVEPDVMEGAA